jgi:flagellar biosynthesis chaperone FliJ
MDKIQQLLMDLRMRRASIKTMLTNYQMFEETYQEEIDQMLDDLSKLTKTIEFLEEKLKQGGK